MHGAHLFDLPNVSQAGLEPVVVGAVAATVAVAVHKFSQCNVEWDTFPQAKRSGC
jgi:hypothetical protein